MAGNGDREVPHRIRQLVAPLLGPAVRRLRREMQWRDGRMDFDVRSQDRGLYPFTVVEHATPLFRPLAGLDPALQRNKVRNLRVAAARLDGLVVLPGQRLSFWRQVGKPTYRRGFVDGLVLHHGQLRAGVGGGLCQMTNLVFWMTLHTPLTVVERWRHSYDVFPDAQRSQPFGSGATCAWPSLDLQIENRTRQPFRLSLSADETHLRGEWRTATAPLGRYEVYERDHRITHEAPGVYVRHNVLWRRRFDENGAVAEDTPIAENHALMMYRPYLPAPVVESPAGESARQG